MASVAVVFASIPVAAESSALVVSVAVATSLSERITLRFQSVSVTFVPMPTTAVSAASIAPNAGT